MRYNETVETGATMVLRTVVKNDWVSAVDDELSECFWGIIGAFLLGGVGVSALGAAYGYLNTPQNQDPAPMAMKYAIEVHGHVWNFVGEQLKEFGTYINDARPPAQ